MIRLPLVRRWGVQSLIAVGVSIVATAVTYRLGWTQTLEQNIVVVVTVWVIGMIFQIASSLHSLHDDQLRKKQVLQVIDDVDRSLLELQSRFREIATRQLSGRPNRVFIDYCRRSLESSLKVARHAAQRGELEVQDHHFVTMETVLAAFEGCQDRTFRCVWLIERGESLFDNHWREYMKALLELSRARRGRRVRVRILFVLEDQEQLERQSVRKALGFVASERGVEYELILRTDYISRLEDGRLDQQYVDFGVYGDHLLFRTKSYEPNIGIFSDDRTIIGAYLQMHDTAMGSARRLEGPGDLPRNISLDEFLDCDRADDDD